MNLLSDLFGQNFFTNTSSRLLCCRVDCPASFGKAELFSSTLPNFTQAEKSTRQGFNWSAMMATNFKTTKSFQKVTHSFT